MVREARKLDGVVIGDIVVRYMGGVLMDLTVSDVTDDLIICGDWEFDRETGAEVDEELGWGPAGTGSYIVKKEE